MCFKLDDNNNNSNNNLLTLGNGFYKLMSAGHQ